MVTPDGAEVVIVSSIPAGVPAAPGSRRPPQAPPALPNRPQVTGRRTNCCVVAFPPSCDFEPVHTSPLGCEDRSESLPLGMMKTDHCPHPLPIVAPASAMGAVQRNSPRAVFLFSVFFPAWRPSIDLQKFLTPRPGVRHPFPLPSHPLRFTVGIGHRSPQEARDSTGSVVPPNAVDGAESSPPPPPCAVPPFPPAAGPGPSARFYISSLCGQGISAQMK